MVLGMGLVKARARGCMVHREVMLRRAKDWASRVVRDTLCFLRRVQVKDNSSSKDRDSRLRRRRMRGRQVVSSSNNNRAGVGG